MGKLLFWVVLIIAVLFVARVAARMAAARQAGGQNTRGKTPPPKPLESMVRCAHCGIHLPRSEALLLEGKIWCSEDHAKRGAS